jgi:CRISPR-associated protein Cmr6
MAIAAPHYVTEHSLANCPPGHRFSLYFDSWNAGWQLPEGEKAAGLRRLLRLGDAKSLLAGLRSRQEMLAQSLPDNRCFVIDAISTSPFSTGLGIEHPIENGFAFLAPYGLPYLAGSGVKGVVRRAAEELLGEEAAGLNQEAIYALFGPEDPASSDEGPPLTDEERRRGALSFWDVLPEPNGGEMTVEIMTPHCATYYQGESSPHDAGQPIPIPFLAVPPGSAFRFVVTLEPSLLPAAMATLDWKVLLLDVFKHAFGWLGFGAKTAVGYGAMAIDNDASAARERRAAKRKEAARLASLSKEGRQIEALRAGLQNYAGKKKLPLSNNLAADLMRLIKSALEAQWPESDRNALADLASGLGFSKIDFQSREKEVKRQIRQLRGEA